MSDVLSLGEPADEAQWRALVEQGLKGTPWARLVGKTADGIPIRPLYREADIATATDVSGFPSAAPFVRGARVGAWTIGQAYEHPDPARTDDKILADLAGGVAAIELVVDPEGKQGVAIRSARDFDIALANVITDIAPVTLDIHAEAQPPAYMSPVVEYLYNRLKGAGPRSVGFNLDPIGHVMRTGGALPDSKGFKRHISYFAEVAPDEAQAIRVDARPVHEAGGTEAQEIATALCSGIEYLRWMDKELNVNDTAPLIGFAVSIGPDVLVEAAKLRALRLCWARVLEASKAHPENRATHIHAFTSRRMMTRYDAWTNILRVTTASFGAAIGGADSITTYPFTDALGLPTAFARRVARNTQNVLLEECRLGQVADPAGGAWFVEQLTRNLAASAWDVMQLIETRGGIVAALQAGLLQELVGGARAARQRAIATRRETITGVTDYPLLDAKLPEVVKSDRRLPAGNRVGRQDAGGPVEPLPVIHWAEPFEALRDQAEAEALRPSVFFANLGALAQFGPRAQFARNLFAAGGVGELCGETEFESRDDMVHALGKSGAQVAVICGTDTAYAEEAENAAQRLKASGAKWVVLAGKPGESEAKLRAAGIDQFVFAGQDALEALAAVHRALGIGA